MKSHLILMLMVSINTIALSQSEKKTTSSIKDVTVFLQGAQVTRTAAVELKPGSTTLILPGTSSKIIENSIQAEVNQNVKIVGVSFRINYMEDLKRPETVKTLEREKARLSKLIDQERTALDIYVEEESMLKKNNSVSGENGVVVSDLKAAVDFYRVRLFEIREQKLQLQTKIDAYRQDIARVDSQLKSAAGPDVKQPQGEIVIKVDSKSEVRAQLKVSYLVQDASWFPMYDVRAKDIQTPIAITYKASVTQQSGEDWENVKLTVSSGNPMMTGARPTIQTWIIGANNRYNSNEKILGQTMGITNNEVRGKILDENGAPLPGVNVLIKGSTVGTVSDANGEYAIALTADAKTLVFSFIGFEPREYPIQGSATLDIAMQPDVSQLAEVVVTGYGVRQKRDLTTSVSSISQALQGSAAGVQIRGAGSFAPRVKQVIGASPVVRQTNVEFTPETPYTIKSENTRQSVDMIEYEIPAYYEYYSAPKLDTDAFLTARLTNWDEYNFLEGEASLFFEGKYIGKTILDTRNTSDTLTLSLGRDRNVVVTRDKKKELSSSQFAGSNRKSLFAYEINVRNKKAYPINIRIEDQLPVPNTKEISVDDIDHSNATKNVDTGVLTWNLKIDQGKTQKLDLRYEVKYPKATNIILE